MKDKFISICIAISIFAFSCKNKKPVDHTLNLEFTKQYEIDNWENARTGLLWTLSFLGAELKKDSLDHAIIRTDSTKFKLDFSKVGFSNKALEAIEAVIDSLKNAHEYTIKNSIDLGAFVSLVIGSSEQYYKITDVESDLLVKLKKYPGEEPIIFPVTNSLISKHTRILKMYTKGQVKDWLFIAEEGEGSFLNKTFKAKGYEVFDIMANGQLRFSIYDQNGKIISASPKDLSEAGKPAKCLWCHELYIQPLFTKNDSVSGYISPDRFQGIVKDLMFKLSLYRKNLKGEIDFSKTQDHSFVERLYIGYMEPSLIKLSREWNIPVSKLKEILKGKTTHQHPEFTFFGDIYFRDSINVFAPFKPCVKPFDIREELK